MSTTMKRGDMPDAGSWVATCLVTGMVWEMFSHSDAEKASATESIKVETVNEYLTRINKEIKEENQ